MLISGVEKLAARTIPKVFVKTAPDRLHILRSAEVSDGKGGLIRANPEDVNYYAIPCLCEPKNRGVKDIQSDRWVSVNGYLVTFPCVNNEQRIEVANTDRLEVQQRSGQTVKILQIVSLKDNLGVIYEAFCQEVK